MTTAHEPDRIALLGAGKVGIVLSSALQRAGYQLAGVWDPFEVSRHKARQFLGDFETLDSATQAARSGSTVLIAVPDDALAALAEQLSAVDWTGRLVAHTSGRYGAEILDPIARAGGTTLAMHPAMAFTGEVEVERERVPGARFALTSGNGGIARGIELVTAMGGVPISVAEQDRIMYHAAMSHGSNHLATLVTQTMHLLRSIGIAAPGDSLRPILQASLDNALALGAEGITGPIVRGDVGTVREHISVLAQAAPAILATYGELAKATVAEALGIGRIDQAQAVAYLAVIEQRATSA